ncbi:MAG: adenine deaminase [Bacteroidales bacterium]|nr:adenine deaminase [Bacteroidales bacterium]MDD4235299.1 adenine deaminase [Bacteroidales bacterium]
MKQTLEGNIIDIFKREIFPGEIHFEDGIITSIIPNNKTYEHYISPGFIDSHVHVESSMLIPSEFARLALANGTVAVVSDPHEIANVLGINGVKFMIENGKKVPLKFFFTAPSCVPATPFETSGANLNEKDIDKLMNEEPIVALGEMMNFPGVINEFEDVIAKLNITKKHNLPIDGHIPGVIGEPLQKYAKFGISTDHECSTLEEAEEKLKLGMNILIREGSAARNFEALYPLINSNPDSVMLCTDDSHPDDLINHGHINKILKLGIEKNIDIFKLWRAATINPVNHYNIPVGLLRIGDTADFIIIEDLVNLKIKETYINGELVFSNQRVLFDKITENTVNNFKRIEHIKIDDLKIKNIDKPVNVIECYDGSLVTGSFSSILQSQNNYLIPDLNKDILPISVINRYTESKPSNGFINGFGLRKGAIASTVAHDSHNIIAIGSNYESLQIAINELIESKGGICFVNDKDRYIIPLPYAGLMTNEDGYTVAKKYELINKAVQSSGCKLKAPFMTLSFMALLVIPELKIGDKGLFDINKFDFIDIYV